MLFVCETQQRVIETYIDIPKARQDKHCSQMLTAVDQCFSIALLLTSFTIRELVLPPIQLDVFNIANISNFQCDDFDLGRIFFSYNDSALTIIGFNESSVNCKANFTMANDPAELYISLVIPPGEILVDLNKTGSSCVVSTANMSACSFAPTFTDMQLAPASINWIWNGILNGTEAFINKVAPAALCGAVQKALVPALLNHTLDPLKEPWAYAPGLTDVQDSTLVKTLIAVINGLPNLFGMLRLSASVIAPTALRIFVDIDSLLSFDEPFLVLHEVHNSILSGAIPPNTTLSVDLWFKNLVCTDSFSCNVDRDDGIMVENVRLHGGGEINRLVDNTIGPVITAIVDTILSAALNSSKSDGTKDGYNFTTVALHSAEIINRPPFSIAVGLAALFSSVAIAVIAYSASRHTHYPVLGPDGNPVRLKRIMMEDSFVVITCFVTMYLFAWSNNTQGAAVSIGPTFTLYTFSLRSTVDDLWNAGLYPLSIFICLFCGVYPYFKLLSIVLFSVVLQRPQSKILQFIDTCGKFSLLDTFMMLIMVTGLQVPGIVDVDMLPSFYVFLVATGLSIFVGNYATHGWRRETTTTSPSLDSKMRNRGIIRDPVVANDLSSDDEELKRPAELRDWRYTVAIPAFAVVLGGSLVAGLMTTMEYHITGLATVVTGSEKRFSLFQLLSSTPWPIYGTGLFTVIIAPLLYVIGFPKSHTMAAWCATDTLLLACVGGLFQLKQFVAFVMGPTLGSVYQASSSLCLPLLGLFFSMLVQWTFIASEIFNWRIGEASTTKVRKAIESFRRHDESLDPLAHGPSAYGTTDPLNTFDDKRKTFVDV